MPKNDIPKIYEPNRVEDGIYAAWEKAGIFRPDLKAKGKPFSISMPPPNATGTLHLGHAVMLALEDIMTRYARMNGRPTLWLPGVDHAAIATENKVESILEKEKVKSKKETGRVKFIKEVEKFVEQSKGTIKKQIRKMGASCDWSAERYTLDAGLSRLVAEVFVKMHNDGLIYRGNRIVNWCTRCQSTLADDEVEYKEQYAPFYYLKYGPITIGTARPETKVLDKIIVVHPNDKRYKKWVGKTLDVPWIEGTVKATFVADAAADMDFGSGAMTITPAHSFVDFELAKKHGFEIKQIIGPDGKLTENGGTFAGMPVREAREAIVKTLQKKGLMKKIDENYIHNLSVCYRCDTPIEPLISEQWFVNVDKKIPARKKSLKELAIHAVKSGNIEIIPDRFNKTYFQWMENLHDWCISRQIWFGHRIPVWYCQTVDSRRLIVDGCEAIISVNKPELCKNCGGRNFKQDSDTLDTWFSSALWTFSTLLDEPRQGEDLGQWLCRNKEKGKPLQIFHPTSVMETGYDILFFWVARMILLTTYTLGEVPFKTVYLHGLVRDKDGRKMSKSLGNGIDPLDMIKKYGADATRLSLVIGTAPGNDTRLYEEKIAGYRNFVNKIWNIARFVLTADVRRDAIYRVSGGNRGELDAINRVSTTTGAEASLADKWISAKGRPTSGWHATDANSDESTLADKWIQIRLNKLIKETTKHLENYEFSPAGEKIYNFLWHDLADWYLEISKTQDHSLAPQILLDAIKLLHPFTPFVTEEIFQRLKKSGLVESNDKWLMTSSWPSSAPPSRRATEGKPSVETRHASSLQHAKKIETDFQALQELVTAIRDLRAKYNLPYSQKMDAAVSTLRHKDMFQEQELVVEQLTRVRIQVLPSAPAKPEQFLRAHTAQFDIYLKLGTKQMREQEVRLADEKANLEKYIQSLKSKLANKNFTAKAPGQIVVAEKKKLREAMTKLKKL